MCCVCVYKDRYVYIYRGWEHCRIFASTPSPRAGQSQQAAHGGHPETWVPWGLLFMRARRERRDTLTRCCSSTCWLCGAACISQTNKQVLCIVALHRKCTRALTSEKLCQKRPIIVSKENYYTTRALTSENLLFCVRPRFLGLYAPPPWSGVSRTR